LAALLLMAVAAVVQVTTGIRAVAVTAVPVTPLLIAPALQRFGEVPNAQERQPLRPVRRLAINQRIARPSFSVAPQAPASKPSSFLAPRAFR
jgi:hypothetical protein